MQNELFYPAVLQAMQACAMDNRGTVHPALLRRLSEQLADFFLTPGADAVALACQFAEVGLALSSVFAGAEGLQAALLDAGHTAEARHVIGALSPLMMAMNDALIALVLSEQEKIRAAAAKAEAERQSEIMVQRNEAERLAVLVNELSTPIIPVYSGILILPLIGAIDSNRAGVVMEALLTKITEHTADAVIIDITGVAIVDTFVAQYLLQTARAASLLGTLVIFTGIGAEIAQTMVQIGVDLDGVLTLSDLEAGMEYALRSLSLSIQPA